MQLKLTNVLAARQKKLLSTFFSAVGNGKPTAPKCLIKRKQLEAIFSSIWEGKDLWTRRNGRPIWTQYGRRLNMPYLRGDWIEKHRHKANPQTTNLLTYPRTLVPTAGPASFAEDRTVNTWKHSFKSMALQHCRRLEQFRAAEADGTAGSYSSSPHDSISSGLQPVES